MYIYNYICVVRVSCVPFFLAVYPGKIILVYSRYPGIFMFAFYHSVRARMCTIKNIMAEGFLETKVFRNALTDTRAQL